jgi:glycosyltransferase involved in cell wall biosynthesis
MKKLAVLLPTYNAAAYLNESIDSVLNQSFGDFDLYIYDDCSTDHTKEIVSQYQDPRVFYIKNATNSGIAKTLNIGLEELLPHYEYIARMDADDWCFPTRFEKQLHFLRNNADIVMCGTQGYFLSDINAKPDTIWTYPTDYESIMRNLLFSASFGHQSIIYQSEFLIKTKLRYDETIRTCEDWDMWTRIVKRGKIANLPDFLMKYRVLPNSNHRSPLNRKKHLEERSEIISRYWAHFNITLSPQQVYEYYYEEKVLSRVVFLRNIKWLIHVFNTFYNQNARHLDVDAHRKLSYLLARRLLDYWKRAKTSRFNPLVWLIIIKEVTFMNKIRLLKSIIR